MGHFLMTTIVVSLFLFLSAAEAAVWTAYGESASGTYYYDKEGMRQLSGNVWQVWIKNVLTREGAKNYKKKYPAVKGVDKISVDMLLVEMDCMKRQFRLLNGVSYDSSGNKITSFDYIKAGEAKWEVIIAASSTEMLSKALCK